MEQQAVFSRIVKRNKQIVPFEPRKITDAVLKAGQATGEFGEEIARKVTMTVVSMAHQLCDDHIPTVEELQDIVEEVLLSLPYKQTAKAYILYREQHAQIRRITSSFSTGLVDQYLEKLDWQVNENSNMNYSLQGLNNYLSSEISKNYWLQSIYSPRIRGAHEQGDLHIHDLSLLSVYCVGWDLHDLFRIGFTGVPDKVESKPAKHFRSILGQIVNFFYTLQGEAAGAQAFSSLDTLLAPFIRYDDLSYKEVKQALQEFVFNLNVPTRVGFQTPFTNITMDLTVSPLYADQPVIRGGEPQTEKYGEFQEEMDTFNRAFLEVMLEGDAKGRVFTFPIPTYNITKDFDWDNPNTDLLWEVTGKYGIPYFSNFINSDMSPEDARSMCCRLRLDTRDLEKRGGGLFGANPLTGSIGVVTLNLPRAGFKANSEEEFTDRVLELMEIAAESLETKRKILENLTDRNLYPYIRHYLRSVHERFGTYWANHFSTIGIIGMNEACRNLLGSGIGTGAGQAFAARVMDRMNEKLVELQERTGHHYNLEATPGEGTSYRLARRDKDEFPEIVCANEQAFQDGAEPYYTNSTQLPVGHGDDPFEVLDLQDGLQTRYTGGTVLHMFIGERLTDRDAVKRFVKTVCSNYHLPYFTISPTFSVCPDHGYQAGEYAACPQCGADCEIYSRVVGYLRPVRQWNKGKRTEFADRKTFVIPTEERTEVCA